MLKANPKISILTWRHCLNIRSHSSLDHWQPTLRAPVSRVVRLNNYSCLRGV